MIRKVVLAAAAALVLSACSTSDDTGKEEGEGTEPTNPDTRGEICDPRRPSSSTPCTTDPDPCALGTEFPGDEYCILAPPEGEGVQVHFGPSDHDDPDEIAKYTIESGEEFNAYGITDIPTTEEHWFNYTQLRMRPGSHHLINYVIEGKHPAGFLATGGCDGSIISGFPGTQNLVFDSPPGGVYAPENEGLGRALPPDSSLCLNYHSYNYGDEVQLREVWANVWFVDESEVTQRTQGVTIFGGPWAGIEPQSQETLTASATVEGEGRIISMFGHRHAWTDRFAVWKNEELVYDSWDWEESVTFNYDSITENPAPDPAAKSDGATSGILNVVPGDVIKIQCDINNRSDNTLYFSNELFGGEMCILFGGAVGTSIGGLPGRPAAGQQ